MKKRFNYLLLLFATLTLSSCLKKGEDDPLLSLHTRMARVVGEWKVTSLTYTQTSDQPSYYITTHTMNGSTYVETRIENNDTSVNTGTESIDWTFEQDGSYQLIYSKNGRTSTSTGVWNFTSGIGDLKNKTQLTLFEQTYTTDLSVWANTTQTGHYVDYVYDIKELRNNKIVLFYKNSRTHGSAMWDDEIEYQLEK